MGEGIPHKKEDPDEINKGVILRMADKIIGGAFDVVFLGPADVTEDEYVLKTLQNLFPENDRMRNDPEIMEVTRRIVQERLAKKNNNNSQETIMTAEEKKGEVARIKRDMDRRGSWGAEMRHGLKKEDNE